MSTTTTDLTPRQTDILEWIEAYIDTHDYPPTRDEIAHAYRIHKSAVQGHLVALRKKGRITFLDGQSRTIRIVRGDA